jgi:hypothetical protein
MIFFFLYRARLAKTTRGVAPLNLRPPKNRAIRPILACALNRALPVVLAYALVALRHRVFLNAGPRPVVGFSRGGGAFFSGYSRRALWAAPGLFGRN